MSTEDRLDRFVALSSAITGFTEFDVRGTGQAEPFCSTVAGIVGDEPLDALLDAWGHAREEARDDEGLADLLRRDVFSDPRLGPIARNVIKLWYVGTWYALPPEWVDAYGVLENNTTFAVSPSAYTEGLLWPAIGANPPGAKGPGYGSWAGPPRIEGITT